MMIPPNEIVFYLVRALHWRAFVFRTLAGPEALATVVGRRGDGSGRQRHGNRIDRSPNGTNPLPSGADGSGPGLVQELTARVWPNTLG